MVSRSLSACCGDKLAQMNLSALFTSSTSSSFSSLTFPPYSSIAILNSKGLSNLLVRLSECRVSHSSLTLDDFRIKHNEVRLCSLSLN